MTMQVPESLGMSQANTLAIGFSLIELMVVIAVVGILTSLALPSFQQAVANQRVRAAISDLSEDFAMMRIQAVKTGNRVGISSNSGGWKSGWTIFVDSSTTLGDSTVAATDKNGVFDTGETIVGSHSAVNSNLSISLTGATGAGIGTVTVGPDGKIRVYVGGVLQSGVTGFLVTAPNASYSSALAAKGKALVFSPTGRLTVQE